MGNKINCVSLALYKKQPQILAHLGQEVKSNTVFHILKAKKQMNIWVICSNTKVDISKKKLNNFSKYLFNNKDCYFIIKCITYKLIYDVFYSTILLNIRKKY